jgi:methylenetetrahydrofolate reductase (NADPH)
VKIDDQALFDALQYKQQIATFMVSQLTFNPEHILVWLREMRVKGITLPLMVGVPAVIPFPRLVRACTEWGLGQSLKYVTKQHGLIRAVVGGKFNPTEVVDYCDHVREDPYLNIANIHFITLNAVKSTRTWWEARVAE